MLFVKAKHRENGFGFCFSYGGWWFGDKHLRHGFDGSNPVMPTLDVSEAFDPMFMDDITVIRRTETINDKGRSVQGEKSFSTRAVVMPSSPNDLMRLPEGEYMDKAISIYTQFRLQGPSRDDVGVETQPDEILWHGSHLVVRAILDYSGYGRGFIQAIAVSMDSVDPPPIPDPVGSA